MEETWQVIAVFDPDREGGDFGYTVGLHDLGLPELFVWARPTDGDDPGLDWSFSTRDLGFLLNDLARRLIEGSLAPGAIVEKTFDNGTTTVELRFGDPVSAHDGGLETFQASREASVCEIRWTLERTPVGERRALTDQETLLARTRLRQLGADAADLATFDPAAELGPNTPLVEELRALVANFTDHDAIRLLALNRMGRRPNVELSEIFSSARSVGLVDEVGRANDHANHDAFQLCERAFADDPEFVPAAARLIGTAFGAAYTAEIVRHALTVLPPTASLLVTYADPDLASARRFAAAVSAADEQLGRIFAAPDVVALAELVEHLDDDDRAEIDGCWATAALQGFGSGVRLASLLEIDPSIEVEDAAYVLELVGYLALDLVEADDVAAAGAALLTAVRESSHRL